MQLWSVTRSSPEQGNGSPRKHLMQLYEVVSSLFHLFSLSFYYHPIKGTATSLRFNSADMTMEGPSLTQADISRFMFEDGCRWKRVNGNGSFSSKLSHCWTADGVFYSSVRVLGTLGNVRMLGDFLFILLSIRNALQLGCEMLHILSKLSLW